MLAPASGSSQSSDSLELASSTAQFDVDSFSQSQSTIFADSDFDSSSFDFAMAFAEDSYSAKTSEDTTGPALHPISCPAERPNESPSGHSDPFPPDLFASLNLTALTPPPSDRARHQPLRFPADLYTRKAVFGFIFSLFRLDIDWRDM